MKNGAREDAHKPTDEDERKENVVFIDYTFYGANGQECDEREAVLKTVTAAETS